VIKYSYENKQQGLEQETTKRLEKQAPKETLGLETGQGKALSNKYFL
jgi:hypothetical protein